MLENFTVTASQFDSVDAGSYAAEYVGNETIDSKYEESGKALAWRFKITSGKETGKVVSIVSGTKPTVKNKCGKIISTLIDTPLANGVNVNLKDCVGKKYLVIVVKKSDGEGTKVETIAKLP